MFERDYLLRVIDQIAQAVARAMGLLLKKQPPEEAEQELAAGYGALGLDREMLCLLDGPSIRSQCGHPDKLVAAVRLLLCDAQVQNARAETTHARRLLRAAKKVAGQLERIEPELGAEIAATERILAAPAAEG